MYMSRFSMIYNLNFKRALFVVIILLSVIVGMLAFKMPDVLPATASQQEFSAERAFNYVEAISQAPHPIGSDEIKEVRDYIIFELIRMGITPEIQQTTVQDYFGKNNDEPVDISNIYAVLPGTNPTGSIVLAGHYDTVPASPGANDDSAAIATLLETARCLMAGQPLQNDVIFLFTDAEEPGQFRYGARHFVENYDSIDDVRLVLNFEAVGRTGPSIMFETGPGNEWLIDGLIQGAPNPVAFSFMTDLYRLVAKGGTDFIAFEEVGINGMDFAYSFERTVYHTALDNVESMDTRSLQHHGDYALNLTQYFGNLDLGQASSHNERDSAYHSITSSININYPASLGIPLTIIVGAILTWIIVAALRKGIASLRGIVFGSAIIFAEIIGLTIVLTLAWWGIDEMHLMFGTVVEPTVKAHLLFLGFLVLTIATMITTRIWLFKRLSLISLALGATMIWWILALLASIYMPGFGIILIWPLFFSLIPLIWVISKESYKDKSWGYLALISVSAIVSIVLMTTPIYLLFQVMGTASPGFSGSPSFPIIGVSIFFWVMLLSLLLPYLQFLGDWKQRKVIFGLLAIAGVCLVAGGIIPGIDIESFGLAD